MRKLHECPRTGVKYIGQYLTGRNVLAAVYILEGDKLIEWYIWDKVWRCQIYDINSSPLRSSLWEEILKLLEDKEADVCLRALEEDIRG